MAETGFALLHFLKENVGYQTWANFLDWYNHFA
jgi:hypothetical protein